MNSSGKSGNNNQNDSIIVSEEELFIQETPQEDDHEERLRQLKIGLSGKFGWILVILGAIATILTIITIFYSPGQPDKDALFIEQLIGYGLSIIAEIIGFTLLFTREKIQKNKQNEIVEPLPPINDSNN